jgi:hypothetical protein
MEAIKKKMQAMKVEKDNLMDRCDAMELVSFYTYFYLLGTAGFPKNNPANFTLKLAIYTKINCG